MAVSQDDLYPPFPVLECSACAERFEIPRKWVSTQYSGEQIHIDWIAAELFMKAHHQEHNNDLISGLERMLKDAAAR